MLSSRMIPRDVSTRWNSTFDMLDMCLTYKRPIQLMTADFDLDLRDYELSREEWKTASQLRDVLKVCSSSQLHLT